MLSKTWDLRMLTKTTITTRYAATVPAVERADVLNLLVEPTAHRAEHEYLELGRRRIAVVLGGHARLE